MQRDFHYYCVAVLAHAAGFSSTDALVVAHASQYVDDSTESQPIRVGDQLFDPVRTAHLGLRAYDWSIQKRVYIPFHFIPPKPLRTPGDSWVTEAGSGFALELLDFAANEPNQRSRLVRIGVALHTLADTWAHQQFSGRHHGENDVEGIALLRRDRWRKLLLENVIFDLAPQIGHAEADGLPDESFRKWRYTARVWQNGNLVRQQLDRDNTAEFLAAARAIYDLLAAMPKVNPAPSIPWAELEQPLNDLLAKPEGDLDNRCLEWRQRFGGLFPPDDYAYVKTKWREEALGSERRDVEWDGWSRSRLEDKRYPMTPGFYDSCWVAFHRAALRQRHYVLERLL